MTQAQLTLHRFGHCLIKGTPLRITLLNNYGYYYRATDRGARYILIFVFVTIGGVHLKDGCRT